MNLNLTKMKRREFLRGLLIASITTAVAPVSIFNEVPPSCSVTKYSFKVSAELLNDVFAFNDLLDRYKIPYGRPDRVEVGYDGDDFVRNQYTVILTYYNHV